MEVLDRAGSKRAALTALMCYDWVISYGYPYDTLTDGPIGPW